jgi:hypothetical protein
MKVLIIAFAVLVSIPLIGKVYVEFFRDIFKKR